MREWRLRPETNLQEISGAPGEMRLYSRGLHAPVLPADDLQGGTEESYKEL